MSSGQAKKLYIMYILEILKKYSDDRHRLKQQDIIDIMKKDYDVACERKAVARNISDLQELGYDIETGGGYYLAERDFEDSELRLLIDSVLASRYIPAKQAKDLVDRETIENATPSESEVSELFTVPLDFFLSNEPREYYSYAKQEIQENFPLELIGFPDGYKWASAKTEVPIYVYDKYVIWGITGRITRYFANMLKNSSI